MLHATASAAPWMSLGFLAERLQDQRAVLSLANELGVVHMSKPIHGHASGRTAMSPTYASWAAMKARCISPVATDYSQYGGRGITVCERWMQFPAFLEDMGLRPDGTSIDRIDNSKGYYKENCRWAIRKQQQRNMRSNRMVTFRGETLCIAEWAERLGMSHATLYCRIVKHGWDLERAMTTPVGRYTKHEH